MKGWIYGIFVLLAVSRNVFASTAYPGGTWEPGPAKYGFEIVDDVAIKMDDGAILRASISYPTDLKTKARSNEKFPVIIEHTPYVQFRAPVGPITYLTEHGYIYVIVRARGAGNSTGEIDNSGKRDGKDSKSLIQWASTNLEGSDGRVGMIGCSWPGMIALSGASQVGKKSPLKAVISACAGFESIHREAWMLGGLPTTAFWGVTSIAAGAIGNTPASQRYFKMIKDEIQEGKDGAYHRGYWDSRVSANLAKKIVENDVPVLLWSGWSDFVAASVMRSYVAFQNAYSNRSVYAPMGINQKTSPRYQLIMGDWAHTEGIDMGVYLQWLDTWIKGIDTGIQKTSTPLHLFEKGTNRWINAATYPLVPKSTRLYLSQNEQLNSIMNTKNTETKIAWGEPENNESKLKFTSEPFAEGATIAGPISTTLFAKSTNTNIVFIAKLFDISPDGNEILITSGAALGSLSQIDERKSWIDENGTVIWPYAKFDKDRYLKKNKNYRIEVSLAPRQWGLKPNHRIRLVLTTKSSATICPEKELPSMVELAPCGLTKPQQKTVPGGVYTVSLGGEFSSTLNIPVLPFKSFPEVETGKSATPWIDSFRKVGQPNSEEKTFSLPLNWDSSVQINNSENSIDGLQLFDANQQVYTEAPSQYFTGSVKVARLVAGKEPSNLTCGSVEFQPGARSNWHSHPKGQLLIVSKGFGLVQEWGKPVRKIKPGDIIWTPANIKHWHGASPKSSMIHSAVSETLNGKSVEWMEKVTDEQYYSPAN